MALMRFREPNQVKWVGVRPAHRGTQIAKWNIATDETTILHTVTAGKVLYLCTSILTSNTIVAGSIYLQIRDLADAVWFILAKTRQSTTSWGQAFCQTFWPPLEVPAGYDIVVVSSPGSVTAIGSIFGWEE